jgi:hypothetical protein
MGMLRGVFNLTRKTVFKCVPGEVQTRTLAGVQLDLTVEEAKWLRLLVNNVKGDYAKWPERYTAAIYLDNREKLKGIRDGLTIRLGQALDTLFEREEGIGEDTVTLGNRPATQWDINNHKW